MITPDVSYVKSWLIYLLIATVGGFFLGALMGGIIGLCLGFMGVSITKIPLITGLIGFLVGIPISFYAFRWCVREYIVGPLLRELAQQEIGA